MRKNNTILTEHDADCGQGRQLVWQKQNVVQNFQKMIPTCGEVLIVPGIRF